MKKDRSNYQEKHQYKTNPNSLTGADRVKVIFTLLLILILAFIALK